MQHKHQLLHCHCWLYLNPELAAKCDCTWTLDWFQVWQQLNTKLGTKSNCSWTLNWEPNLTQMNTNLGTKFDWDEHWPGNQVWLQLNAGPTLVKQERCTELVTYCYTSMPKITKCTKSATPLPFFSVQYTVSSFPSNLSGVLAVLYFYFLNKLFQPTTIHKSIILQIPLSHAYTCDILQVNQQHKVPMDPCKFTWAEL